MAGLLALLDDLAVLTRSVASGLDDVLVNASQASSKAAGVIIDDTAVMPTYLEGTGAERELPVVWRIAKGSLRNKVLILLPLLLLLDRFAPQTIPYLLLICGSYLCYEGAEKVYHYLASRKTGHSHEAHDETHESTPELSPENTVASAPANDSTAPTQTDKPVPTPDPASLEEARVEGAIKTDFVMSAEIMVISLATLSAQSTAIKAASLLAVAFIVTFMIYGSVALIVKMDDIGLAMAQKGRTQFTRSLGRFLVKAMPGFLRALSFVGTLAMLWVGGEIVTHSLELAHLWAAPYEFIHTTAANATAQMSGFWGSALKWLITATMNAVFGFVWGIIIVILVTRIIEPLAHILKKRFKREA